MLKAVAVVAALVAVMPATSEASLRWKPCGTAPGVECATLPAPLDYDRPQSGSVSLAVARTRATDRAHRIGSLFLNFGGPGISVTDPIQSFGADTLPALSARFDLVAMDARGVGQSRPVIDCAVDQQRLGARSQPFTTPLTLALPSLLTRAGEYVRRCLERNGPILAHVSSANVARDMDLLRRALGESTINFYGFSYGTVVGATYASLFPGRQRAMVLEAPLDAETLLLRPWQFTAGQAGAAERALGRFLSSCPRDGCGGFGGSDPWDRFDRLVERLDGAPIPAAGAAPVDGDDVRIAALDALLCWQCWADLGHALALADSGDGSEIRRLADIAYGRDPDTGAYDAGNDASFAIIAGEQRTPRDVGAVLAAGDAAWDAFDHFWFATGYSRLPHVLWPIHDDDAFHGPFRVAPSVPPALVVAGTYDPATFYRGGVRLTRDLGNARLLTLRGDGHGAYLFGGSPDCIDPGIEDYLHTLALPRPGTICEQRKDGAAAR